MDAANPTEPEAELDRAMGDFLREMDAFVASWTAAVRRFAAEPAAARRFRERPVPEPRRGARPLDPAPAPPRDSMWDRELDG